MKKIVMALLIALTLMAASAPAFGSDKGLDIATDVLIVRPVSLAATVIGTALFIVALPFSLPSGSVGTTAQALVATPYKYTFVRPVGDFSSEWEPSKIADNSK
jgi:hypothetical protein